MFEAHEAMSKADFTKCLSIAAKELHETVFWLRVMEKRKYIETSRLIPLMDETKELLAIVKTLIARTRRKTRS